MNSYFSLLKRCSINFCPFIRNGSSGSSKSADYCMRLVRNNDNENFLCTLLLPSTLRAAAFAIRAFNIEIARIQDQTSESHIGLMRLKFWEQSIDKIYSGNPPKNPVALELSHVLKTHKLNKIYLKRLISSRQKHMNSPTFQSIKDMEDYADMTTASVYFLLLDAAGYKNIVCDHCASHLGKAQGITNLLRALPHNISHKSILLPQSLLMKFNISEEKIFRGEFNEFFKDIAFEVATCANNHLNKARKLASGIPKECKSIFLPAVTTGSWLRRLEKKGFDAFDSHLSYHNSLIPFQLFWYKFCSKY